MEVRREILVHWCVSPVAVVVGKQCWRLNLIFVKLRFLRCCLGLRKAAFLALLSWSSFLILVASRVSPSICKASVLGTSGASGTSVKWKALARAHCAGRGTVASTGEKQAQVVSPVHAHALVQAKAQLLA